MPLQPLSYTDEERKQQHIYQQNQALQLHFELYDEVYIIIAQNKLSEALYN